MKQNESIEYVLENMDRNIIYKTKRSRLSAYLFIVIGIASFVVYSSFKWEAADAFPHFLFMIGSISFICGIVLFFSRKSYYVCAQNRQKLIDLRMYFQVSEQNKLVNIMESGELKALKELKTSVSDGLKLRLMATKDGQVCFSQVIAYINNDYLAVTEAKRNSTEEAVFLTNYFHEIKK